MNSGKTKLKASGWVDMGERPIDGITLRLAAPFTVHGRRAIELPKGVTLPRRPRLTLTPYPADSLWSTIPPGSPGAWADAEDNFTLPDVYPGQYRILPPDPPEGYYLDAVRIGEAEVTSPEVEIDPGTAPIVVAYKGNGGTLRGTAENCASGEVAAVPRDPAYQRPGFVRRAFCDAQDRYRIADLRPGDYDVLALIGEADNLLSPSPFRSGLRVPPRYAGKTTSIAVRAGETTSAGLRALPRQ